jgi:L-aspartate oxidase
VRTRDAGGHEHVRPAGAVVLATGGMGHLFARTTNPVGATADGVALAARAGAALADLEMTQFHPTALAVAASPLPLVSEAVRGAGAVLRDAAGHAFMAGEHPQADLGPRDVVARAIWRRARADGRDVALDLTHLDPGAVHARFPSISAACREHGVDLARDPVPVTPAAHYAMGGVLTDLAGRTTLPGLWAIGECASTGLHGANRLASNSLLEAVVMGRVTAADLADPPLVWPEGPLAPARPLVLGDAPGAEVRAAVQRIMWEDCGVERDADGLARAARALDRLPAPAEPEAAGLVEVARMTVAAAARRTESRGAHFRADHPAPDPAQAHRTGWCGGAPFEIAPAPRGAAAHRPAPPAAVRKEHE